MLRYSLHVAQQSEHLPYEEEEYLGRFKHSGLVLRTQKVSPDPVDLGFQKVHFRSAIEIIRLLSNSIF